jgi:hypothetical protein
MKKASFGDAPQTLYRCSRLQEIVPGTEKMCVIAHENGGTKHKNTSFRKASQTMYRWSRSLEIVPGTEKCAL